MIIISKKFGQLGNRLFLFAHFIAFAIENNRKIMNLAFHEYANLFENTKKDIFCRFPAKQSFSGNFFLRKLLYDVIQPIYKMTENREKLGKIRIIAAYPCDKNRMEFRLDDPKFLGSIEPKQILLSRGSYFCDYPNLLKHADKIREYFKPLTPHETNVNDLVKNIRGLCDVLIGIHIRRGDYETYQGGKFYYDLDTYLKVMGNVMRLFPNKKVGFLVCSNETLDKNKFSAFRVAFGTSQILEDMYLLAGCDYIIGPSSTYSRWASFYGNVPNYILKNPDKTVEIEDFISYEKLVSWHIDNAEIFPRFESDRKSTQIG